MTVLAWHFLHPNELLRDDRPAPSDGVWLTHDGPVEPCRQGFHASTSILDALCYHPPYSGCAVCRVEVRGDVQAHG